MLFHMQGAIEVLDADIMDVQVVASGDGADAVENIFGERGPWDRTDYDIGVRKDAVDGAGDFVGDLAGTLEGDAACEADGDVGKVAVAGAANADTVHFEQAIHAPHSVDDTAAGSGGSGVEESVNSLTGEARADEDDDAGDEKRGDWVSID
jgi:hypothetical protein